MPTPTRRSEFIIFLKYFLFVFFVDKNVHLCNSKSPVSFRYISTFQTCLLSCPLICHLTVHPTTVCFVGVSPSLYKHTGCVFLDMQMHVYTCLFDVCDVIKVRNQYLAKPLPACTTASTTRTNQKLGKRLLWNCS